MQEFTAIIEQDEEGYFIADVPSLKGCHTQAKSLDTLMKRVREAIQLCLEVKYGIFDGFIDTENANIFGQQPDKT